MRRGTWMLLVLGFLILGFCGYLLPRTWLNPADHNSYQQLLRDGENATDVVLREKEREKMIARLTGWECVRITWADLHRPEQTAAEIRKVLFRDTRIAG